MNKAIYNILVIILLITCFLCCKEDFYFESVKTMDQNNWTYQNNLEFSFEIKDTSNIYNLYLDLDHSTEYPYQNIYLQVHTEFPSGKKIKELLPINLADKTGRWFGNCDSEWCDLRVNLQQNAFFNAAGTHTITLEQFMRVETLEGVRTVALKLEETGKKR